jgi:hypothetical protein
MCRALGTKLGIAMGVAVATSLAPACATQFQGDANFPGGARGCAARCETESLRMSQYVFVGEYSSACVCEPVRGGGEMRAPIEMPAGSSEPADDAEPALRPSAAGGATGTLASIIGVMIRMREAARAQRQD